MKTTSFLIPSMGLGLVVIGLAILPLAVQVRGTSTSGEKKETFEYYQNGKTGRGRHRQDPARALGVGSGVKTG
jgi:hypothetical protein